MIIVSYGTSDGIYDRFLDRLRESCEQHGLRHDMRVVPPFQRPEDARRKKPSFIAEMLAKHKEPVVWIDADAIVTRSFDLPAGAWDIGLVPNTMRNRRHVYPVASFVVAAAPTQAARGFLATWDYLCQWDGSPGGDHHRLIPVRHLQRKMYSEIDLTAALRRAITRDFGGHKENTIQSDLEFYASRVWRRISGQRRAFRSGRLKRP